MKKLSVNSTIGEDSKHIPIIIVSITDSNDNGCIVTRLICRTYAIANDVIIALGKCENVRIES